MGVASTGVVRYAVDLVQDWPGVAMYDGGDPMHRQPPAAEPPAAPPAPWTEGFAGRVLVQGVGMLGVAVLVMAVVDDRAAETEARMAALESKLELVQLERDRMQRLSHELATELDDASMEAEIVRWQLAYTEERFARLEAERDALASGRDLPPVIEDAWSPGPAATFVSLDPIGALPPDAVRDALEAPLADPSAVVAMAASDAVTDAPLPGEEGGFGPMMAVAGQASPGHLPMLELEPIDGTGDHTDLKPVGSQLERNRAIAAWNGLLEEAAAGECRGRGIAAERRCRDEVRRELWPSGSRAVDCILSGNAAPDYVSDIRLDQLPTHSQPLAKGAVIFCDGGLRNL